MKTMEQKTLPVIRLYLARWQFCLVGMVLVPTLGITAGTAAPTLQWVRELSPDFSVETRDVSADGLGNIFIAGTNGGAFGGGIGEVFVALLTDLSEPGDFDDDFDVDGNDFLVWQRDGLTPLLLAEWQTNFGTVSPAAASVVPEPGGMVLALLAGASVLRRRKRSATCHKGMVQE